MTKAPAPSPCSSCPYRRDVPPGVWHPEEYEKLPAYDRPTPEQPAMLFLCHSLTERLCSGWVGCHDMDEALAIRVAQVQGTLTDDELRAVIHYETTTPLFSSGREAADHGLSGVAEPSDDAVQVIEKVINVHRRQASRRART